MHHQSRRTMVWACVWVALLLLSGCGSVPQAVIGVGELSEADVKAVGADVVDVYIATSRERDDDPAVLFSGERAGAVSFVKARVSIPKNHRPGQIERPRRAMADPRTEFAILPPEPLPSSAQFIAALNRDLTARPSSERDVLVFVHGYNTDLTSAIFRLAQFAHDINYPGIPVLFSWASGGRALDYVYDLNSVLHARDALLETGDVLSRTSAGGFNIVAHSMGTLLTVEAMRQAVLVSGARKPDRFRIKNIALAAPDIDLDLFRRQLEVVPTTDVPIYVLTSDDDRALGLSTLIAGNRQRVGRANIDQLADLGVIVIDLSAVADRETTSHTKFANSPEVIKVLGDGLRSGNTLETRTDSGFRLANAAGLPARVSKSGAALVFD